ncbi:MAG TPA: PH domain-containing protein [Anaerolineae bacterium]|nr:PH domain-containing protein [Anaerolineae bacterium]
MTYRARFSEGGPLGLLYAVVLVSLDVWLVRWLVTHAIHRQEINFGSFLVGLVVAATLPLLAVVVYHTWSWLTLRYHLDRNGLAIRWAGSEVYIPIRDIQRIIPGKQLATSQSSAAAPAALASQIYESLVSMLNRRGEVGKQGDILHRHGLHWPGHERGAGLVPGIGRTRFFATRPLAEQLLVIVAGTAFAISPNNLDEFVQSFEARRALGPNRLVERSWRRAPWFAWPVWRDRTAWTLLGAAILINLALFGYLSVRYPGLDFQLPLHFNNLGQVDRIGAKIELFALPIIGLIILGTNLVLGLFLYRRERAGSYLLWGSSAAAQGLFWLATFSLIP